MRKIFLAFVFAEMIPVISFAQDDDVYFVPKKEKEVIVSHDYVMSGNTYYSGSDRSVDDYNRRFFSRVEPLDSVSGDTIYFNGEAGSYPDTVYNPENDYTCTRKMSRFDDYSWTDPYWAGFYAGRSSRWWYYGGLYDPWFYDSWYYSAWYDPWYYGWGYHYGWYYPHYHHAWWYPVGGYARNIHSGTLNHHGGTGRQPLGGYASGMSGSKGISSGISNVDRTRSTNMRNRNFSASNRFGVNRNTVRNNNGKNTETTRYNNNFNSNRSNSSFNTSSGNRSFGSGGGFNRSSGGGVRSGGGFGGRR